MIRFSAALVAVAIGVLIGGIATSKLVLVYLAIVVSAVSLSALAVGEGRSLSRRSRKAVSVTPRPPGTAAAADLSVAFTVSAAGAPSAETAASPAAELAVSPAAELAVSPAAELAPSPGDAAPSEKELAARNQWASPSPARTSWAPAGENPNAAGAAPAAAESPATASPEAESAPLSWFDRLGESAAARTEAAAAGSGSTWARTASRDAAEPGDLAQPAGKAASDATTVSGDDDDDWPTRYSWLDDETDPAAEAGAAETLPEITHPADEPGTAAAGREPSAAGSGRGDDRSGSELEKSPEPAAAPRGDADAAAETEPGSEPSAERETASSAAADTEAADTGDPAGHAGPAAGTGPVSVVRGVPRYHDPDCVLIRFMPGTEVQRMAVPQAEAAGCTPCTVCEPQV